MDRRQLITGLVSLIAAPAIVRADSLMQIKGDRYFYWEWSCPILPSVDWYHPVMRQDLIDTCFGPNGRPYIGTWTFFGKDRNIYSDKEVGFRKVEAPPRIESVLVGCT